jgi:hypothetical protein
VAVQGIGGSIFIVSVWHATYNLFAGSAAAHGLVAAIVPTGVMACAALIVIHELLKWARRRRIAGKLEVSRLLR